MIFALFGEDGVPVGFYDDAIHDPLPEGAIGIGKDAWTRHMEGAERLRLEHGVPVLRPIPEPSREARVSEAQRAWESEISHARSRIAGTADPVKLAEYADKAANAQAILDGNASPAMTAEAEAEAARLGLPDAAAIGALWIEMAEGLRAARTRLNVLAPDHEARIGVAEDAAGIEARLADARAALAGLVSQFAPQEPPVTPEPQPAPEPDTAQTPDAIDPAEQDAAPAEPDAAPSEPETDPVDPGTAEDPAGPGEPVEPAPAEEPAPEITETEADAAPVDPTQTDEAPANSPDEQINEETPNG